MAKFNGGVGRGEYWEEVVEDVLECGNGQIDIEARLSGMVLMAWDVFFLGGWGFDREGG